MRLRLPLSLRSALLACSVLFTTVASASVSDGNLGNVMYIGDSITHGVNSGSWRWAMHKIFTDNGVSYTEKGIMTGNFSGGVAAGTSYGGKIFQNIHSSAASARTYEIAGRANGSNYGRFDGSNIKNWLGLSTEKTKGGSYAGQTFPEPINRTRFSCSPGPTISFPTAIIIHCSIVWMELPPFCWETWIPSSLPSVPPTAKQAF